MTLEIVLEDRCRAYVDQLGGKSYKWTGSREKLDLIIVTHTGVVGIAETKRKKTGRLTPQQEEVVEDVSAIDDGIVIVFDDFEVFKRWYWRLAERNM